MFPFPVKLIHFTHIDNLLKIKNGGLILDQKSRKLQNVNAIAMSGSDTRKLCEFNIPYEEIISNKCLEAYGVYFRVYPIDANITIYDIREFKNPSLVCGLVFNESILNDFPWHLNLCENNGFYIYDDLRAPFCGGNLKKSYDSTTISLLKQSDLDPTQFELVIRSNVPLVGYMSSIINF